MRPTRQALALIVLLAGCSAAPALEGRAAKAAPAPRSSSRSAANPDGAARAELRDLVDRINRRRGAIGCRALEWDGRLAAVARRHSEDMVRRGFFSHTNPDGEDPFDRMRRAGIRFRAAAENLAAGQRTGAETFRGWMESRGHRRNLEACVYTRVGIGLYRGHWTCVLARPATGMLSRESTP